MLQRPRSIRTANRMGFVGEKVINNRSNSGFGGIVDQILVVKCFRVNGR